MNPVNHFEIPYDEKERAEKFYKEVFGWKLLDHDMGNDHTYTLAYTCEVDDKMMCKEPNVINGGLYKRGEGVAKSPVIVITVPNLDEHLVKIKDNGGEIVMDKQKVGEMGLYAQVKDPEGNTIGVWESLKKDGTN
jgi:uncharacterized protein